MIAWLFYDSAWGLLTVFILAPLLILDWKREKKRRCIYQLEQQVQTGLIFTASALEAGYSVENAWKDMEEEIIRTYGEEATFSKLLHQINQRVAMREPIEQVVWEAAKKQESYTINSFADVFYYAKRSGGNLPQIMRSCASRISQSFSVQEEIQLALASRQLELLILHAMPLMILGYLKIGMATFLSPLYHNVTGVLIMSGCLGIYGTAWWLSKKIIQIGV